MVAPTALDAEHALPGTRQLSSHELGWTSALVRTYAEPPEAGFTTVATDDYLLVMQVKGACRVELRTPGSWRRADYRPGSVGLTRPGATATLRWRQSPDAVNETMHVHIRAAVFAGIRDGSRTSGPFRNALQVDEPLTTSLAGVVHAALVAGASPLVGDSLALGLAAHLLDGAANDESEGDRWRSAGEGQRFSKVVDYMHEHLADVLLLEDLADIAHLSVFHFLRAFRDATGMTPRHYLQELRLLRASKLLSDERLSIQDVVVACGYSSAGNFAAAFRRRFGLSPSAFRRAM